MEPAKIVTEESPREYIRRLKDVDDLSVSGGWGYSLKEACVIKATDSAEGVPIEYEFAWAIIRAEVFDKQFANHDYTAVEIVGRTSLLTFADGVPYDVLTLEVVAEIGDRAVRYQREFWFDISSFWDE